MRKFLLVLMFFASFAQAQSASILTPGDAMSELLVRTLAPDAVVIAKPGADGAVAYHALKNGEGKFIMTTTTAFLIAPVANQDYPIDPFKEFEMVSLVAKSSFLLVTRAGRYSSVESVMRSGKPIALGGFGAVSACASVAKLLRQRFGGDLVYAAYKSSAQLATDLTGDHIDMACATADTLDTFVAEGRWTVLANLGSDELNLPRISGFPTIDIKFFLLAKQGVDGSELLNEMRSNRSRFSVKRYSVPLSSPSQTYNMAQQERKFWQSIPR